MFNIERKLNDGELTLSLSGRLDTTTFPELEKVVKNELDQVQTLMFNLEKMEYISSAGLRVLLLAQKTMNAKGRMAIINASAEIMDIFEVTGFSDILNFE